MKDQLRVPTAEEWADTLMAGIGLYGSFPDNHPDLWPQISALIQRQGYSLTKQFDGNWYARSIIA